MLTIGVIIVAISIFIVIVGIVLYCLATNKKRNYFAIKNKKVKKELDFYIKKHAIFRIALIVYSVIHYSLNVISITFSMITIYMVLDESINSTLQAIFLLIAAISTNLNISLRFDRIAEGYAQAMRIMERAILNYIKTDTKLESLCEADEEAEKCIGNKFI